MVQRDSIAHPYRARASLRRDKKMAPRPLAARLYRFFLSSSRSLSPSYDNIIIFHGPRYTFFFSRRIVYSTERVSCTIKMLDS